MLICSGENYSCANLDTFLVFAYSMHPPKKKSGTSQGEYLKIPNVLTTCVLHKCIQMLVQVLTLACKKQNKLIKPFSFFLAHIIRTKIYKNFTCNNLF